MSFLSFYQKLPTIDQFPFYIKGYTEALKTFKGVRVIPNASFLTDFPSQFHSFAFSTSFPSYFLPLFMGENCYGFVLKGPTKKRTPQFSTVPLLPGLNEVKPNSIVLLCEGFKDVYLLRMMGLTALPILTAVPSQGVLRYLARLRCRVIFVPDNDETRETHILSFEKVISSLQTALHYSVFHITGTKDLGGVFDSENDRTWALFNAKVLYNEVQGLLYNQTHFNV